MAVGLEDLYAVAERAIIDVESHKPLSRILRKPRRKRGPRGYDGDKNKGRATESVNMGNRLTVEARKSTEPDELYVYLRNCYPCDDNPSPWIEQLLWLMAQTQALMRQAYDRLSKLKPGSAERKAVLAEYKEHRKYFFDLEKSVRATTRLGWEKNAPKQSVAMQRGEKALEAFEGTEIGEVLADVENMKGEGGNE